MTRRHPEHAFGIGACPNRGITRTGPRSVEVGVAAADLVGSPNFRTARAEALALDTANVRRGEAGVELDWAVFVRAGQPTDDLARLSWCPGTELPPRAQYASVTVRVT